MGMPRTSVVVWFLHSVSGKVKRLTYGVSVAHSGAGPVDVEAVTVTVMRIADWV